MSFVFSNAIIDKVAVTTTAIIHKDNTLLSIVFCIGLLGKMSNRRPHTLRKASEIIQYIGAPDVFPPTLFAVTKDKIVRILGKPFLISKARNGANPITNPTSVETAA